jgi:hypothetical protein
MAKKTAIFEDYMTHKDGMIPIKYDKHGPLFDRGAVIVEIGKQILCEQYFQLRAKQMANDFAKATILVDNSVTHLGESIDRLVKMESQIAEKSKKVSGSVRDSFNKLAGGLGAIEKTADFSRLERYVELLERAESAMTSLAKLHDSGKLEKIAGALK